MKKYFNIKIFFYLLIPFSVFSKNLSNCISCNTNPIIDQLVYKLRDPATDREDFRSHLKKLGEYMGIKLAKHLHTKTKKITTILSADAEHHFIDEDIVLITIFRAGLPLYEGLHRVFPQALSGFFGMKRLDEINTSNIIPQSFPIELNYYSLPSLKNKCVIIADTMIATASSLLKAIKIIERFEPKKIFIVGTIAAQFGIEKILEHNPDITIFIGAIDPILNHKGYIVPGLGDAGDRSYGIPQVKIQREKN